jgi:hypothetical protein
VIQEEQEVFDATPYLKLIIDKDGRWFQNGAEIIHPAVRRHFMGLLERTADGGYRIRSGREVCRVEVEDAPFVVTAIGGDERRGLTIVLNDDTAEPFHPDTFWIGDANVPYVKVKDGTFHARFSRSAYYRIAEFIHSTDDETFFLEVGGNRTKVRCASKGAVERGPGVCSEETSP